MGVAAASPGGSHAAHGRRAHAGSAGQARTFRFAEGARGLLRHLRNQRLLQPASGMNRINTDLHRNILDVFNEYGVQIMNK
jgi:hypothetical protein